MIICSYVILACRPTQHLSVLHSVCHRHHWYVMLWRALQAVPNGFYIDVGAWSPDIESVTRAFYHRGWSGINIEPSPLWHAKLVARRVRDINLGVALSDQKAIGSGACPARQGRSTIG